MFKLHNLEDLFQCKSKDLMFEKYNRTKRMKFSEAQLEHANITLLKEQGYTYVLGSTIKRGKSEVLIKMA